MHDPTQWHPAVDPATGCKYGHEHGDNPLPPGSPFTPLVFGGDEATPNENLYKHNGYKIFYYHRNSNPPTVPNSDPCDDVRFRVHMDVTPLERVGQYHSFEVAIAHCANGRLDVSYIQGWADFGTHVHLSTREGGDPGTRPIKFAPGPNDFAANGLNIWEVWYGRTGVGLDTGWLMGEVPSLFHDGSDPNNPSTWNWTGGTGGKRKIENFNFYGWRDTRRGEFWTDPYGRSVDLNSDYCRANVCLRQYISPLFPTSGPGSQIILLFAGETSYDVSGVNFPMTFPAEGGHLPWAHSQPTDPTPAPPTDPTPTPEPPAGPTVRVDVVPSEGNPGDTVEVSLNLFNVSDLYGLQAQCQTDPAVLGGMHIYEADGFNATNSLVVDKGFNPADGSWLVAATRIQPNPAISGNLTAFKLVYEVLGAGSSAVNCAVIGVDSDGRDLALAVINGAFNTLPVEPPPATETPMPPPATETPAPPPATETPEPPTTTPEPQVASIAGQATYQNRPNNAGIIVQLRDANRAVVAELITNADGAFSFTDVPTGEYTVKFTAPYHLGVVLPATMNGMAIDLGVVRLLAGDTNGDSVVDLTDAGLVGANFGVVVPPAPDNANLNGDGVVDIRDLALVGGNFEKTGATLAD